MIILSFMFTPRVNQSGSMTLCLPQVSATKIIFGLLIKVGAWIVQLLR